MAQARLFTGVRTIAWRKDRVLMKEMHAIRDKMRSTQSVISTFGWPRGVGRGKGGYRSNTSFGPVGVGRADMPLFNRK